MFGAFVPYVVAAACKNRYYEVIWRTSLGLGVICPIGLLILRVFLQEPEEYQKHSMKYAKIPYRLVLRFYGFRLMMVSLVWFIYDVSTPCFTQGNERLSLTTVLVLGVLVWHLFVHDSCQHLRHR